MEGVQFYHIGLKMVSLATAGGYDDYTLTSTACNQHKFMRSLSGQFSLCQYRLCLFILDAGLMPLFT